MKIKTQSKTILFSRDWRGGERDGRQGRGKEVRIKDKVGIERTETQVFRILRVDYPNFAATGTNKKKIKHEMLGLIMKGTFC